MYFITIFEMVIQYIKGHGLTFGSIYVSFWDMFIWCMVASIIFSIIGRLLGSLLD